MTKISFPSIIFNEYIYRMAKQKDPLAKYRNSKTKRSFSIMSEAKMKEIKKLFAKQITKTHVKHD